MCFICVVIPLCHELIGLFGVVLSLPCGRTSVLHLNSGISTYPASSCFLDFLFLLASHSITVLQKVNHVVKQYDFITF